MCNKSKCKTVFLCFQIKFKGKNEVRSVWYVVWRNYTFMSRNRQRDKVKNKAALERQRLFVDGAVQC